MKLNRKQTNWYILLAVIIGFVILYFINNSHSITDTDNYIIEEPWRKDINIYNWDYLKYYSNMILGLYQDFPWQLQLSYFVILLSILSIIILLYVMSWDVYSRKKEKRTYNSLRLRYYDLIKRIISESEPNIPDSLTNMKMSNLEKEVMLNILIEIRMESDISSEVIKRMQNLIKNMGLYDFMERQLLTGKVNDKIKVIQTIRILHMEIPDSTMARFINDKNHELRKAARLYYILSSKEDPFKYFESYEKDKAIITWDMIEIHQMFKEYNNLGKKLPSFIPVLNINQDKSITQFFIKEIAYWGSDKEVDYLKRFLNSDQDELRISAMETLAKRKDKNITEAIKTSFYIQNENIKRKSLISLLEIDGEASVPFFEEAFKNTSSRLTKRTALKCLWNAGDKGKNIFSKLRAESEDYEKILFKHVEDPNINSVYE